MNDQNEELVELKNSSILIVDENIHNLKSISNILKDESYTIFTAKNSKEALNIALTNNPDLIIDEISLNLNNNNNIFLETLKGHSLTKNIPLLFLTYNDIDENIVKSFQYGAIDYISKPHNSNEIKMRIKTHLSLILMKKQIEDNNKTLQKLNTEKNELLSAVTFELKSPLYIISMIAQKLRDDNSITKKEIKIYSHTIVNTIERILEQVKVIFDFSLFEEDNIQLQNEYIDFKSILESVIENNKLKVDAKNINLKFDTYSTNTNIYSDAKLTYQIVENLILNTIEHSLNNSLICLSIVNNRDYVQFIIQDFGKNDNDTNSKNIFLMSLNANSKQHNAVLSYKFQLLIIKKYIELLKGKFWVESDQDKEIKYFLCFPRNIPDYKNVILNK